MVASKNRNLAVYYKNTRRYLYLTTLPPKTNTMRGIVSFCCGLVHMRENTVHLLTKSDPIFLQNVWDRTREVFLTKCYLHRHRVSKSGNISQREQQLEQYLVWGPSCGFQSTFTNYKADILDSISHPCLTLIWFQNPQERDMISWLPTRLSFEMF